MTKAHDLTLSKGHKSSSGLLFTALCVGGISGALLRPWVAAAWREASTGPSDPRPRLPALYESKTGQFQALDSRGTSPTVVYLGDSVTDWANLEEYLEVRGGRVINRGISGDTSAGLLSRVRGGFAHGAEACIVLIGVNDLVAGAAPEQIAARVADLCSLLLDTYGVGHIVLEGWPLYPSALEHDLAVLNRELEKLAAANQAVSFLDLNMNFVTAEESHSTLFVKSTCHQTHRGIELRVRGEIEHLRLHVPTLDVRLRAN